MDVMDEVVETLEQADDFPMYMLDVQTRIENTAMDHRLQLCLPTDVVADTYQAGQAFTMLTRPVGPDPETTHWKEPQYGDRNCNGVALLRDTSGGLAFLAEGGIHEVNAMNDRRRTLAVTLYRSFAKTVGNDDYSQMDGQLLRPLTFSCRLMPLTPQTGEGHILRCRDALQAGVRLYTMYVDEKYRLGTDRGFMRLEGEDLALSVLKRPEDLEADTVIVRLYNCSDRPAAGCLELAYPILEAWQTDLLERPVSPCAPQGNRLCLTLGPRKIQTLRIRLKKP